MAVGCGGAMVARGEASGGVVRRGVATGAGDGAMVLCGAALNCGADVGCGAVVGSILGRGNVLAGAAGCVAAGVTFGAIGSIVGTTSAPPRSTRIAAASATSAAIATSVASMGRRLPKVIIGLTTVATIVPSRCLAGTKTKRRNPLCTSLDGRMPVCHVAMKVGALMVRG